MIELAENVIKGQNRAVARAISWIENDHELKESLIDQIYPYCGNAIIWGITGPPGSGKSSLADHLIIRMRALGKKVAVIAVDPSSPFSGGAILGDRIRMQKHATDEGVFIRSMASRDSSPMSLSASLLSLRLISVRTELMSIRSANTRMSPSRAARSTRHRVT